MNIRTLAGDSWPGLRLEPAHAIRPLCCIVVAAALIGCQDAGTSAELAALKASVSSLEAKAAEFETTVSDVRDEAARTEGALLYLNSTVIADDSVTFDPSDDSAFQVLATSIGFLTVKPITVRAHANGSKLALQIGNLTNADIAGYELTLVYGPKQPDVSDPAAVNAWVAQRKTVTAKPKRELKKGAWTTVEVTLPEYPPEQVGQVQTNIAVQEIHLLKN